MSSKEIRSRSRSLLAVSSIEQFLLSPIVHPENRSSFEKFALDYYATDGAYPNGTGYSNFGGGIYDIRSDGSHIRSSNHTNSSSKKYDFLVPVLMMSNIPRSKYFLSNTYSTNPIVNQGIEDVLDCVKNRTRITQSSSSSEARNPRDETQDACSLAIDYPHGLNWEYASLILTPVFPENDLTGEAIVGLAGSGFTWKSALSNTPHQDFNFRCSIEYSHPTTATTASDTTSTTTSRHRYRVINGIAEEITERDSPQKDHHGDNHHHHKSFIFTSEGGTTAGSSYTITYHSVETTSAAATQFFPILACVCCIGMTLLISTIFLFFIQLTDQEYLTASMLLDSKRTFVRFISHEIRTPLNTINLSTRLLTEHLNQLQHLLLERQRQGERDGQEEKVNSPFCPKLSLVKECLGLIVDLEENSSVAVATLSDLINYDKIESKTFTIEKKDVNVWSVLEKTIQPLSLQAKEKNIEMELKTHLSHPSDFADVDVNPQHLRLVGDSIKLGQVIRNLVSNALKFTPANGTVKISAFYQPKESPAGALSDHHISRYGNDPPPAPILAPLPAPSNGHIVITVTDTGPGLTLEQQDAMFQEGVQFNPNELQAGQGSGLGLWISKEIVSLHDGDITVRSRGLGMGTTFVVELPVFLQEEDDQPQHHLVEATNNSHSAAAVGAWSGSAAVELFSSGDSDHDAPLHVLVVDDAISNRKLVCRLLQSKGFICHQAENGQECVNMILAGDDQHHPFDLILMDYEMPIMNGPSAARKLREMKSEILIIGLTGNVLPEDKEYFLEHGANAVLTKPVDINELLECIRVHRGVRV